MGETIGWLDTLRCWLADLLWGLALWLHPAKFELGEVEASIQEARIEALERERDEAAALVGLLDFQFMEGSEVCDLEAYRENARRMEPVMAEFLRREWVKDAIRKAEDEEYVALREVANYPPDAGCTKHLGEPWPCPRCAALQEADDED